MAAPMWGSVRFVETKTTRSNVVVTKECALDRQERTDAISLFERHQKYAKVVPAQEAIVLLLSLVIV